jgi:hypothetical protein
MMREEERKKKSEITFLVCVFFFMRTRLMLMRLESIQGESKTHLMCDARKNTHQIL